MVSYCFLSFSFFNILFELFSAVIFLQLFRKRSGSQLDWIQSAIGVVDPLSLSTSIICNCEKHYVDISKCVIVKRNKRETTKYQLSVHKWSLLNITYYFYNIIYIYTHIYKFIFLHNQIKHTTHKCMNMYTKYVFFVIKYILYLDVAKSAASNETPFFYSN